jgi:hypothetical protein
MRIKNSHKNNIILRGIASFFRRPHERAENIVTKDDPTVNATDIVSKIIRPKCPGNSKKYSRHLSNTV